MDKMLRLAVCDDEPAFQNRLRSMTATYMAQRQDEYLLSTFSSGEELLGSRGIYDIVLLDVQLEGIDGMQVAMELKERCQQTNIIFVSSFVQYAPQGYRSAIRYILKQQLDADFAECMDAAMGQLEQAADVLMVSFSKQQVAIPLGMLLYLESDGHMVRLHLEAGADEELPTQLYGKITDFRDELRGRDFLQCHKSYLVNLDKVAAMNMDCFIMHNGDRVPISRRFAQDVKRAYGKYLTKGRRN